jgi:hypothetical protein
MALHGHAWLLHGHCCMERAQGAVIADSSQSCASSHPRILRAPVHRDKVNPSSEYTDKGPFYTSRMRDF